MINSTQCCGQEIDTPFCPRCGKAQANPIAELIQSLREKVKLFERNVERGREMHVKTRDRYRRWLETLEKLVAALHEGVRSCDLNPDRKDVTE